MQHSTTGSGDDLAPWEQPMAPSVFTLTESARRLGHYAWAEMRTFEIVGAWTTSIAEAPIKARLATHANEHAWHAELWHRRFPELRAMDPDAFIRPANDDVGTFFDALAALESTIERVAGVGRVLLPHLIATYTFHRNRASVVSDGPVRRSLDFILADDHRQLADLFLMLDTLATGAGDIDRAATIQVELERLLVTAGGVIGRSE